MAKLQFSVACILFNAAFGSAACYHHDGSLHTPQNIPAFLPCDQTVGIISQCCGTNWTATDPRIENERCQQNGLCLSSFDNKPVYWRGTCTDRTWKSPQCLANLCTDPSNGGHASSNAAVSQCSDGSWCCGGDYNSTCCDNKLGILLNAKIGVANTTSSSTTATSTLGTTTAISTPSSSATMSAAVPITPASSSPSDLQSNQSSMIPAVKAGIALGTGIGVLAIIGLIVTLIVRRRMRRNKVVYQQPMEQGPGIPELHNTAPRWQEIGSNRPEAYQYEVEGSRPIHELPNVAYR